MGPQALKRGMVLQFSSRHDFKRTKRKSIEDSDSTAAELSKSQDSVIDDGTTTVVVIFSALLRQCLSLLSHDIHPMVISDSLHKAALKAVDVLTAMAVPIELSDCESLIKAASTSLNSKVISQYSSLLASLAVNSVLSVVDLAKPDIVDLRDIKIVKKLGGTVTIPTLSETFPSFPTKPSVLFLVLCLLLCLDDEKT
nr:t-complex protein 1 subunit delta [Quercus suber]